MKTTKAQPLLEEIVDRTIAGHQISLIRVPGFANAYVDRSSIYKVLHEKERQLAEIKRGCRRLRGLLDNED